MMNRSTRKRLGLAAFLIAILALPWCGCGDPHGVQDNPYAAPSGGAGSGTVAAPDETPVDAAEGSAPATE